MKGSYKEHQKLLQTFFLQFQESFPKARIFQRHVGLFLTQNGSPINIGSKGQADAWAYVPTIHGMIALEFEFKSGSAKQTKEQKNWENVIKEMGGHYFVVTNPAVTMLEVWLKK